MDTTVNPTISFPTSGKDPTASPATLTFDSGSWTNATTYVATYDVANQNVTMPAVDVQVSGAKDGAENTLQSATVPDVFGIDTHNPGAHVLASPTQITDATLGSEALTITLYYDEPMDTSVAPTIALSTPGGDPTASPATLTFHSGTWTNDTTYAATYDVADQNVAAADVTVHASGAQDVAGNLQAVVQEVPENGLNIDTLDPAVLSVTPNLTTISDANVGSQTFTLTVAYSTPMDTTVNPAIAIATAFNTGTPVGSPTASPATLTFHSGSWSDPSTYVATYDVADRNLTMSNLDVQVTAAKDVSGHAQVAATSIERVQCRHAEPDRHQRDAERADDRPQHRGEPGLRAHRGLQRGDGHVGGPDDRLPDLGRGPDRGCRPRSRSTPAIGPTTRRTSPPTTWPTRT